MSLKNMPKTRTSAQRYNARMNKLFDKCQKAKKAEAERAEALFIASGQSQFVREALERAER